MERTSISCVFFSWEEQRFTEFWMATSHFGSSPGVVFCKTRCATKSYFVCSSEMQSFCTSGQTFCGRVAGVKPAALPFFSRI